MTYSGSAKVFQGGGEAAMDNTNLNTMRLLESGTDGPVQGRNCFVDVFNDASGVNVGVSAGETRDIVNKLYSGVVEMGALIAGVDQAPVSFGDAVAESKHVGMRFVATSTAAVTSVAVDVGAVIAGFNAVCGLYAVAVGFPPKPGAQVGGNSDSLSLATTGAKTFTWSSNAPSLTAATNYYVVFSDSGASGNVGLITRPAAGGQYRSDGDDTLTDIGAEQAGTDWKIEVKNTSNMVLVSASVAANKQPGRARLLMVYDPVDATTPNTDLKGYVSRDGGSTFTQVTFVGQAIYSGTKKMLIGEADISAQPAGTGMTYKVETLNTKNIQINNVAMSWS